MSDRDTGDDDFVDEDQLQPEDTLEDQEVGDILDRGYSPPDYRPAEHPEHETLDERLADEVPDVSADGPDPDYPSDDREVGESRAGRLVAPDEGEREDVDSELVGRDAGVDGAGASAEEAAVHLVEE